VPANSESRALALAAKWVRQNMPDIHRLIAYADPARGHAGTIYRAAGWRFIGQTEERTWNHAGRPRRDAAPGPKLQ